MGEYVELKLKRKEILDAVNDEFVMEMRLKMLNLSKSVESIGKEVENLKLKNGVLTAHSRKVDDWVIDVKAADKMALKSIRSANRKLDQLKAELRAVTGRLNEVTKALELHKDKNADDLHLMKVNVNQLREKVENAKPADHKLDYCYAKIDQMVSHENKMTAEFEKMRRQMANLKNKVEMLYIGDKMDERI